jgi:two-component system response regulator
MLHKTRAKGFTVCPVTYEPLLNGYRQSTKLSQANMADTPTHTPEATVLLVEDSADDVFLFERALGRTGIKTRLSTVRNGTAAVEYLKSVLEKREPDKFPRPDVIFLDLKLPQLSGFEVLRWVRQQNFDPPLSVIVLTGSDEDRDKRLVAELGVNEFVTKPLRLPVLKETLMRVSVPSPS